jgi:hypothetical protein
MASATTCAGVSVDLEQPTISKGIIAIARIIFVLGMTVLLLHF